MAVISAYSVLPPMRGPVSPRNKWRAGLLDAWRFDSPAPYAGQVLPSALGSAPGMVAISGTPTELTHRASPWGPAVRFRTSQKFTNNVRWTLPVGWPQGLGTATMPDFTFAALMSYEDLNPSASAAVIFQHHNTGFGNALSLELRPTNPLSLFIRHSSNPTLTFASGVSMSAISRLVVVKRGATFTAYVNGVEVGSANVTGGATVAGDDTATPVLLGSTHDCWRLEARLYCRPWTAGEVAEDALDPFALWRREPLIFPGSSARLFVPWPLLHSGYALGI